MHITIFGVGSRGDIQPLIALAVGLKAHGHHVRFATHQDFAPLARAYDLEYYPLAGNSAAFFGGRAGAALRERLRTDVREYERFFDAYLARFVAQLLDDAWSACQDTDAVLSWPWMRVAPTVAEKLGIPAIIVSVVPTLYLPTRAFANPYQAGYRGNGSAEYNLESWNKAIPFFAAGNKHLHAWRRKLGMPVADLDTEIEQFQQMPHIFGFSHHVLPKPDDWPAPMHLAGYWFLDHEQDYAPPAALQAFLEAGPPPVAIGFGSQVGANPRELTNLVIRALQRAGKRAIFISGFGGLKGEDLPANVHAVKTVPYDWLLPRVSAIVHHGGSGSTSAGLRAGKACLAIPFGYEQPLWGQRVHELGVGAAPIPAEELTEENLAEGIVRIMEDASMHAGARQLGEVLRQEDGVGRTVALVDRILAGTASPRG